MASFDGNPFLEDFQFPPFDRIEASRVLPWMRALFKKLTNDLEELERNLEPNWPNLVEPLEKIVGRWLVSWGMINILLAVKCSRELQSAIEELQADNAKFGLRLGQSKPIYNAFKAIRKSPDWDPLSDERKCVVHGQMIEARLQGVLLDDEQRLLYNTINESLAELHEVFSKTNFNSKNNFSLLVLDKQALEGLPVVILKVAAEKAVLWGVTTATVEDGPWIITIDNNLFNSVMYFARNRRLREVVCLAFLTNVIPINDLSHMAIMDEILKLRLEKANLLGYNNYAEASMAVRMATVEMVEELLYMLCIASWEAAVKEYEEVKEFAEKQESGDLKAWDLHFWSARLRESKYALIEEEFRPYFSLPNVLEGLFSLAKTLFGIEIEAADGLAPVWNSDVRFYCVKDSGSPIAYFYFDPYRRPAEKNEGAWMNPVISRSRLLTHNGTSVRLPVANIVCNLEPPLGDKPSLLLFSEVLIVFHEFGHALQQMLTTLEEGLISGIREMELDVVELSSKFMENWCYHRETLMSIAKHYETGESLPEDGYLKILALRTFCAASTILSSVKFAKMDLDLHTKYIPGGSKSIYDVYLKVTKDTQVILSMPDDWYLSGYCHVISGGKAGGLYGHKWAEMLAADAFSAFEEAGLDNINALAKAGKRFRETILSRSGGKSTFETFEEFMGREPSIKPLLRHNGLL